MDQLIIPSFPFTLQMTIMTRHRDYFGFDEWNVLVVCEHCGVAYYAWTFIHAASYSYICTLFSAVEEIKHKKHYEIQKAFLSSSFSSPFINLQSAKISRKRKKYDRDKSISNDSMPFWDPVPINIYTFQKILALEFFFTKCAVLTLHYHRESNTILRLYTCGKKEK